MENQKSLLFVNTIELEEVYKENFKAKVGGSIQALSSKDDRLENELTSSVHNYELLTTE